MLGQAKPTRRGPFSTPSNQLATGSWRGLAESAA